MGQAWECTPPKTHMEPPKLVVCRCFSFCNGVFSGFMLVFGGVIYFKWVETSSYLSFVESDSRIVHLIREAGIGKRVNELLVKLTSSHMGVSKNRGTPKWMVKIMENPIKMDDLGVPLFLETPISPAVWYVIYIHLPICSETLLQVVLAREFWGA